MCKRLAIYLLGIPVLYFGFNCAGLAYGQEAIIFGPQTFSRSTGAPQRVVTSFSVNLPLQDFTISVRNGEGRSGRVSSAIVELNGLPVVGPNEFNKQVDLITKPVSPLQGQNSLAVELRSAPGTSIIVTIRGRFPSVTKTIPPGGGTVNLNALASVTFPNGAFTSSNTVKVSASNSPDTQEDFSATAEGPRLSYEIRINSGNVPPATSFDVVLNVPESFVSSLAPDHQLEIFAQPIETSVTELLGHFHGFPSVFDSVNNTVRATLPPEAFTNQSSLDDSYEAILIVGVIPKYPPTVGAQSFAPGRSKASAKVETVMTASLNLIGLLAASTPMCEGSPLGNPLEGLVRQPTSQFNPPSHAGVDYPGTQGENVHPVADGTIARISFDQRTLPRPDPRSGLTIRGWGRYVVVTHADGSQTLYAHLVPESTNHLVQGQPVTTNDIIGQVGSSGGATGPHLHLEYSPEGRIFVKRSLVDPDPCVLAGQSPPETLVLNPQNPTFSCSNPSLTFTATGGRPPYTWSTSKGVITPNADTTTATLTPPENNPNVPGLAYNQYTCEPFDTPICRPNPCACTMYENAFGCADQLLTSRTPFCGACSFAGLCGIALCEEICTPRSCGEVVDRRTQAMINAGCGPCQVTMQGGATVTVTDTAGTPPVSTTVKVQ